MYPSIYHLSPIDHLSLSISYHLSVIYYQSGNQFIIYLLSIIYLSIYQSIYLSSIYKSMVLSYREEWNPDIFDNMDEAWRYYAKWESHTERDKYLKNKTNEETK